MGLTARHLDRLLQFERVTLTDDGFGMAEVWAAHGAPVAASRQDVSDLERAAAGSIEASLLSRFVVRSTAFTRDLTPRDRLTHDGRTWNILGIKEAIGGRRRFLEITARALWA